MTRSFLHFQSRIGRRLLAVEDIIEVIPMVAMKRESDDVASSNFCGLINFRGNVIPVFDFGGFDEAKSLDPDSFLIVAKSDQGLIAVVATELEYLIDVGQDQVNKVNASADREVCVVKLENEMIRVADTREFMLP